MGRKIKLNFKIVAVIFRCKLYCENINSDLDLDSISLKLSQFFYRDFMRHYNF